MHKKRRWQGLALGSALAVGAALTVASGPAHAAPSAAAARVDNPYVGATPYVNPEWKAHADAEPGGSAVSSQPTYVWLDRIAAIEGVNGGMGLRDHLDAAKAQGADLVQIVVYDLPGRDCAALASNGELGPDDLDTYEHSYIDPIKTILADSAYANLKIAAVIEPDSLPNLVTNADGQAGATQACATMKQNGNYVKGVGYALAQLGDLQNVYNYVDAGHHGWLGWDTNLAPFAQMAHQAATASGATVADVAGFAVNTANYSALHEPNFTVADTVNGTLVRQAKWIDWNQFVDEQSFAGGLRGAAVTAGFDSGIGMLIDTSRNGWGGANRPAGPGPTTTVDDYVNGGRIDRRIHLGNWCNQSGAGIGERPKAAPAAGIDAYVWVKPPGESDGASQAVSNDEGKGFDQMCDPTYTGNGRNGNSMSGALPNSPLAGHWFSAQFQQLLANAYPSLNGGDPGNGDTQAPGTPTGLRVTGTTATSASLSWTASTDNVGVDSYLVYRGGTQVGTATGTTFTDTGLSASTAYQYTVRARDAAGNLSAASGAVTATTLASGGDPGSGACSAVYHVDNDWGAGFTASVTVTNTSTAALSSWQVTWTWPGNQQITNSWNSALTSSGQSVTARSADFNGSLAAGSSTSFGFQATYSGSNAAPTLTCTTG
jgi:cellulose 1,4-beta-cellobiosidase